MKSFTFVWRLTLTCGHLKLWGPFRDATHERYVGDHTTCDICKRNPPMLIAKVEVVNPNDCSLSWLEAGLGE